MQSIVNAIWYGNARWHWLLLPLELLFLTITAMRRYLYRLGVFRVFELEVPVVVVGNITAGGTGKTPVTLWLAQTLKRKGFNPGIVSRGYGGRGNGIRVEKDSDAELVGDEPLLLARRSGCAVVVDSNRVAAATTLVDSGADVIIADDGLQHYRLARDFEICVIDAARGLGNGHRMPAGPLRESRARLASVDQVLVNGAGTPDKRMATDAIHFHLVLGDAMQVSGKGTLPLASFVGTKINAAAAIGNPRRFFEALRGIGIELVEHAYADHASIDPTDFESDIPLLITEKDAVKLAVNTPDNVWYVPVDLQMDETAGSQLIDRLVARLKRASDV